MHCTWFNEKKKKVNFPYIFCGLFPLLTRPHICCPHRPSPAPHNTTWERSATPTPPRPPGGTSPGTLGPGPAGLQLLTSPGACAPQTHSTRPAARLSSTNRRGARGRAGTLFP